MKRSIDLITRCWCLQPRVHQSGEGTCSLCFTDIITWTTHTRTQFQKAALTDATPRRSKMWLKETAAFGSRGFEKCTVNFLERPLGLLLSWKDGRDVGKETVSSRSGFHAWDGFFFHSKHLSVKISDNVKSSQVCSFFNCNIPKVTEKDLIITKHLRQVTICVTWFDLNNNRNLFAHTLFRLW